MKPLRLCSRPLPSSHLSRAAVCTLAPLLGAILGPEAVAHGSVAPTAPTRPAAPTRSLKEEVSQILKQQRSGRDFESALTTLKNQLGTRAVPGLLELARDARSDELDRYAAILGTARLGGREAAPLLTSFLSDSTWMVRLAALRALGILKNPETSAPILKSLQDPALVIRSEAIDTITALRPSGAPDALLRSLQDGSNYSGGKAQVIPQKALRALVALQAKDLAPKLKPLLQHEQDPQLQAAAIDTLEKLTGKTLLKGRPLAERVQAWKSERL